MKKSFLRKMFVVIFSLFILLSIWGGLQYRKVHSAKTAAVTVLRSIFTATQQDAIKIKEILSTHDQNAVDAYFKPLYGDRLTESGYAFCYANRIFTASTDVVEKEGSSLQVESIELSKIYQTNDEIHYSFTVKAQVADSSSVYQFSGYIKMLQVDTVWKVNSLSVKQIHTD